MRQFNLRLYLVIDPDFCAGRPLEDVALASVAGGVTLVQLRIKQGTTRAFVEQARLLHGLLARQNVPLIINDRVDVALAIGAEGVHLGQSDMPPEIARRLLGGDSIVGLSVNTQADLVRANALDVDYLGVGPVYSTATKTDADAPCGCAGVQQIRASTHHRLVGIGGIQRDNAAAVMAAGADGVAVVSAICAAHDPAQAAHELALCLTAEPTA